MIEKYLLVWKKNKKRVWKIWSEIGEKENDVITYYNLTKNKEYLSKQREDVLKERQYHVNNPDL